MSTLYWISEYGRVFLGYLLLMFLWPLVVFNGYLRSKTRTYRFGFCVTVSVVIINTVVLLLGLFHILNRWMIVLIFYGWFAIALLKNILQYDDQENREAGLTKFPDIHSLQGKYHMNVIVLAFIVFYLSYIKKSVINLLFLCRKKAKTYDLKRDIIKIKKFIVHRVYVVLTQYGLLAIVLIYGMLYFSYGAFQLHSYGHSDLYVHHRWTSELAEGNIFVDGVCPEAMHCFIYCMKALFNIEVYSSLLFLQGIHIVTFSISVYLLLRQVFQWKYTPIFVLMLFLTLDLSNAELIYNMSRLQITMPLEFGLYTVFLSVLYLMKYIYDNNCSKKSSKYLWNEDLFLFLMTLAASIMIHFYVFMLSAIVCTVFAVFALNRVLQRRYLIPLIISAGCAFLIGITPMAGALMTGVPFHASVNRAINSMNGDESRKLRTQWNQLNANKEAREDSLPKIYQEGYIALYGQEGGRYIFLLTIVILEFCFLIKNKPKFRHLWSICSRYPFIVAMSVIYVILYAAPIIGLPDIIPGGHFLVPGHLVILAVMSIPVDVLFTVVACFCSESAMRGFAFLSAGGVYAGACALGSLRGYLFYELMRYESAAEVTESIVETYPQNSYTIVSPTDDLYQIIGHGWHEELLSFVEKCNGETYTIPSEYVFIYIEKKPILHAQAYFFTGPLWFADEKYSETYWRVYSSKYPDNGVTNSPEIIASRISQEAAAQEVPEYENPWVMYSNLENRTILESRVYEWRERFLAQYPSALDVYYEDDAFVCYCIRQDMDAEPYNLAVK